jgi:exodeoxyribonuclease V gamma subunit
MPVHLFMLAPTPVWTGDDPARHELVRAAKKAAFADEREQALRALDGANLLLAASGVVGRDVQVWVEETELAIDGAVPRPTSPARTPSTLLERTQRFVADAAPMPAATDPSWPVDAHDHSLEVHACHGDLRQCEALREQLLQRFFDDSSLEPRHVIIMTPDVATFGPLLQAVLARPIDTERGGLPVHVSDLGLRLENPLAEALLALVQLAGERVTATRLLELFALAPVRRAFGIDDNAEPVLAELVHASNLRWAWSADDRAAHGQPADAQNTVAFALERLALGTLMDDAADLVSAPAGDVFAPTPLRTAERVELFGKFAHALRTLRDVAESLVAPRSVSDWSSALRATLARVTAISDLEIPWRRRIESTLDELLPAATRDVPATADRMLERAAVLALLEPAFDLPGASGGAYGGAITVCALEPMRAVPFRVVAIVGLSEGAVPRQGVAAEWDPFAKRKPGEPTRTALDRHLFLEALLSARDAFWLFGNGFDPKRGTERPLAAVCHEVLTVLEAHTRLPAKSLLRAHALQPWSHAPGEAPVSFDRPWVSASEAISRVRDRGTPELAALQRTGGASMFPPLAAPRGDLTAARLAQHLDSAARALVEGRLDLRLRKPSDEPADREPLDAKDLEKWDLYDELVERLPLELLQDNGAAEAYDSLRRWARTHGRAAGTLPPGARGAFDLDRLFVDLDAGIDRLRQGAAGKRIETGASYTYRVGAVTITGRAPFALGTGDESVLSWLSPGGVHPTRELEAWLTLLVARAAGVPLAAAFVASAKEGRRFRAPEPHVAAQLLEDLVATLVRSQEGPVLRAPRFSYAIAKAASRARGANAGEAPSSQSLVEDALDLWASSSFKKGALDDRYTFELFGHWTDADLERHADRIVAEAEAVWGPLHDAVEKAPRTKGTVNE